MKKDVFGIAAAIKKPPAIPPRFQPLLSIRVTNGRTKSASEFAFELPAEGFIESDGAVIAMLQAVLRRQGILPPLAKEPTEPDQEEPEEAEEGPGAA